MRSDRRWPVAIIGAGFSGTMTAAQLARKGIASVVIEGGGREGQGAAYSTTDPAHLLNVPAGNMSAWADVPDDFARRVGDKAVFARRRDYGGYVRSILEEAKSSGCVSIVAGQAIRAIHHPGGWTVGLEHGDPIEADALVLATGNQPPGSLTALEDAGSRLIADPWSDSARQAIADIVAHDAPVLIVGTGLTMVDVVLSLHGAGHQGEIVAVSRRGLIPRAHSPSEPAPIAVEDIQPGSVTKLLSWIRTRAANVGWRPAIDSLRPHSRQIWQSLGIDGQRQFLRHARPWWDVHRHRIAPQVASLLVDLIGSGRLRIAAGRVRSCAAAGQGVRAVIAKRSGDTIEGDFSHVFNCTGPLGSIEQSGDPILRSLLADSFARSDSLGLGLDVDDRSRVEGSQRLWAVGPLTKGAFWEIVAVPDIRVQAAEVAEDISGELAR